MNVNVELEDAVEPPLIGTVPRWVPVTLLKVDKLREDLLTPNLCGYTLQIDARHSQASYDSITPSSACILHAVSLHDVPSNDLRLQITDIYASRTIDMFGYSEQFLIETG